VRRRDQRVIWLDCLASAIEWDGEAARLVTAIDITERKEGEASLRASEERFRQLVENIKEGFILIELPSYNLLYLSRACGEIWGRSVDDAYRDPRLWFEAVHADDREAVTAARQTLERGTPAGTTFRVVHTDGTSRWVRSRMFPVQDAHGRVYRLVGLVEDITEMRRTEEQLRHSQKMEAVGRLAGGIAHDFNNLLTAILGYSDFALEDLGADHPSAQDILAIRTAGESAESLTRQLLAFSRRQVVQPRTIDVNDVIRRVDSLLRRVIGEDIELHLDLAPSLPVVTVDPGQLEQVLMNLAVNARDAMPQGGRVVIATATVSFQAEDVAALRAATPGPHVALSVSDTGTGMDDAVLKRVFEPFFTTKEQGRGTGLGLATVHGIVQQWLGTIDVASQVGRGSTFTISLPAAPGDASDPWDASADAAEQYGTETVLLVEDQPQTRDVICEALRRRGYTVIQATDGAEAIEKAEQLQGALHLLLTDVVMPGINGRQLAERIQSVAPSVRVIYMSGYTDDTILQHGVLDPRLAFIQKPFTSNVVLAKVREVLSAPEPPPLL
jgi:PAS domain S-box-containing protein